MWKRQRVDAPVASETQQIKNYGSPEQTFAPTLLDNDKKVAEFKELVNRHLPPHVILHIFEFFEITRRVSRSSEIPPLVNTMHGYFADYQRKVQPVFRNLRVFCDTLNDPQVYAVSKRLHGLAVHGFNMVIANESQLRSIFHRNQLLHYLSVQLQFVPGTLEKVLYHQHCTHLLKWDSALRSLHLSGQNNSNNQVTVELSDADLSAVLCIPSLKFLSLADFVTLENTPKFFALFQSKQLQALELQFGDGQQLQDATFSLMMQVIEPNVSLKQLRVTVAARIPDGFADFLCTKCPALRYCYIHTHKQFSPEFVRRLLKHPHLETLHLKMLDAGFVVEALQPATPSSSIQVSPSLVELSINCYSLALTNEVWEAIAKNTSLHALTLTGVIPKPKHSKAWTNLLQMTNLRHLSLYDQLEMDEQKRKELGKLAPHLKNLYFVPY